MSDCLAFTVYVLTLNISLAMTTEVIICFPISVEVEIYINHIRLEFCHLLIFYLQFRLLLLLIVLNIDYFGYIDH